MVCAFLFDQTKLSVGRMLTMSFSTQSVSLPFAHLNLRRNPFGEFSTDELAALAQVEITRYVSLLSNPKYVVQFVGEKGYGKTTHLLAIASRFASAAYVHIAEGQRAAIPSGWPLLIDEAQRLTWWQQIRVFRGRTPLVLGTHYDFSDALRRAGRSVETIAVERELSDQRLCEILNARIRWVRRQEGQIPSIRLETARRLREQFGPNVRRVQQELYLKFQEMSAIQDV